MNRYNFKICVFGDVNVGKTTLLNYLEYGRFKDVLKQVGAGFYTKSLEIERNSIALTFWDYTKSSWEEATFYKLYYDRVSGGIFVFDLTNKTSLDNLDKWLKEFREYTSHDLFEIPILIIGNKADLIEKRIVSQEKGFEVARSYKFYSYYECSARTGQNVDEAFSALGSEILRRLNKEG